LRGDPCLLGAEFAYKFEVLFAPSRTLYYLQLVR
jgi:hypothetical protein